MSTLENPDVDPSTPAVDPLDSKAWQMVDSRLPNKTSSQVRVVLQGLGDADALRGHAIGSLMAGNFAELKDTMKALGEEVPATAYREAGDQFREKDDLWSALNCYRYAKVPETELTPLTSDMLENFFGAAIQGTESVLSFFSFFAAVKKRKPLPEELENMLEVGLEANNLRFSIDIWKMAPNKGTMKSPLELRLGDMLSDNLRTNPRNNLDIKDAEDFFLKTNHKEGLKVLASIHEKNKDFLEAARFYRAAGVATRDTYRRLAVNVEASESQIGFLTRGGCTEDLIALGEIYLHEKKLDPPFLLYLHRAQQCFTAASYHDGLRRVADQYREVGNLIIALEVYEKAGTPPTDPEFYRALGDQYASRGVYLDKAQVAYRRYLELRGGSGGNTPAERSEAAA